MRFCCIVHYSFRSQLSWSSKRGSLLKCKELKSILRGYLYMSIFRVKMLNFLSALGMGYFSGYFSVSKSGIAGHDDINLIPEMNSIL